MGCASLLRCLGQLSFASLHSCYIEYQLRPGVKGGDATSARRQITLCDLIWYVSSCSGVIMLHCELLYPYTLLYHYLVKLLFESDKLVFRHGKTFELKDWQSFRMRMRFVEDVL